MRKKLDSQIIISREDNTDFLALGYMQTDTSLVSALGGALANFAEEIGLAGGQPSSGTPKKDAINFSRFQNGILASKIVPVNNHNPIVLIAIKGFDGEDKELDFIVDYASRLAQAIVTKFETDYSSVGIVPKIDDAFDIVSNVAHQMYKSSSDKVKRFTKDSKEKINVILENLWTNQMEFEKWSQEFISKKISHMTQNELQKELAHYFYILGMKTDAFFPLMFSSNSNPFDELSKLLNQFFIKKAPEARKEIANEVAKTFTQLKESSKVLAKKGQLELAGVDLINESVIFEKILITKYESLPKVIGELINTINEDLYKKLFKKYPLNFVAMSKENVFEKKELEHIVTDVLKVILNKELENRAWMSDKILTILRDTTSKYSPEDLMKRRSQILEKTYNEFVGTLKREHPFIVFADPALQNISKFISSEAEKNLEKFKTTLDEAVVLYNAIGQIHSSLQKEKLTTTHDLMILYFLISVLQTYQFRDVPDMVYSLIAECLGKTDLGTKVQPEAMVERSINDFEKKINFKINLETKKLVLRRVSQAKPTQQRFENFEHLAYFFKSFRTALESVLSKILQIIFGPEKFPTPPNVLTHMIHQIAQDLQNAYILKLYIDKITKRPNARELFAIENSKILEGNTKFKQILPSPIELAKAALNDGWIKSADQVNVSKLADAQLLSLNIKIPSLKIECRLSTILEKSHIIEKLWQKYAIGIIESRQKDLKNTIDDYEKRVKVSAGEVSGKQRFSAVVKGLKESSRYLGNFISGGGFMRKLFSGGKELTQLFQESSKEIFPMLRFHPEKYHSYLNEQKSKSISHVNSVNTGDFQELMKIYASLWITDSNYIEKIIDRLFWDKLTNTDDIYSININLDNKITQSLKNSYKKDTPIDQKEIIRRTIEEEIIPPFNKIIRIILAESFAIFKDDREVKFDEKANYWYIEIGVLNIPNVVIKSAFNTLNFINFVKIREDITEVRLVLNDYYAMKRTKDSQTIEEFIRKGAFNMLNKKEIKALEFFSELIERYIGESAAEHFFSNIHSLAQMIISTVE